MDFPGVDPTGCLDGAPGIQAAIDFAHAIAAMGDKAILRLPTGTYRVSETYSRDRSHEIPSHLNAVAKVYSDSSPTPVSSFSKPVYFGSHRLP